MRFHRTRPSSPSRPRHAHRLQGLLALLGALLLAGCQELGPERASAVVRFREMAPLDRERLVVTLTDTARQWYLEGIDLTEDADGWLVSRVLRTAPVGRLVVRIALRGGGTTPAASAEVALPLGPQAHWRVDIFPSSQTSAEACGDCAGLRRLQIQSALRPPAQDWLYVTWTAVAAPPAT